MNFQSWKSLKTAWALWPITLVHWIHWFALQSEESVVRGFHNPSLKISHALRCMSTSHLISIDIEELILAKRDGQLWKAWIKAANSTALYRTYRSQREILRFTFSCKLKRDQTVIAIQQSWTIIRRRRITDSQKLIGLHDFSFQFTLLICQVFNYVITKYCER